METARAQGSGMWLTRVAINRPWTMIMAILAVLVFGAVGYTRLGVELYPDVNFPIVLVSVGYPGASPEVVETLVSRPLEDAVAGLPNLDKIETFSSEGGAAMAVYFTEKASPGTVAIEVEKRVAAARGLLPPDALPPTIEKFDFTALPVQNLSLSGDRTPEQLYDLAVNRVRPRLEAVDGVGQVRVLGGRQREIQVKVDPSRLRAYGLTLQQVSAALGAENVTLPGGQVEAGERNFSLRVDAKFRTTKDVEETPIALPAGGVVRVRDLGTVVDGFKTQTVLSRIDGREAVSLTIMKESSANVTGVARGVQAEMARLNASLPDGLQLATITDNSIFIRSALDGVQRSLVEAVVLTGLVLLVFLHSWRSTLIVVLAIPTSLIATFGTMWLQGFSLNIVTTLALALTVGILVDDSIVVLENIHRHLSRGESPRLAAINGRSEIGMAAIAITLVDVVVFTPVGLMTGQVGQFFRQFGFTVVAATLFSLTVSFTLTPLLASRWLREEDEQGKGWLAAFGRRWERWFAGLERAYARLLPWSLARRWWIVGGAFLALAAGIALPATGVVRSEFMPAQDSGYFFVQVELPPGASVQATSASAARVEEQLLALPEVETVYTTVGQGLGAGTGGNSANVATITVRMVERSRRSRTAAQLALQAKTFGAGLSGAKVEAAVEGVGAGAKPIQVSVFGDDLKQLDAAAARVMAAMRDLPSVADVGSSGKAGSPEYVIAVDRRRAADLGLSAIQVASTVRTAYAGSVATQLRQDSSAAASGSAAGVDVRVQLADNTRKDLDRLASVPLLTAGTGSQVLLGQVANISSGATLGQIQRKDKQRMITIGANLAAGKVLGEVTPQVDAALKQLEWPEGTHYRLGGTSEAQDDTFKEFGQAIGFSILLTYMLLVALYESPLYPLVVLAALPLALVGAMAALAVSGETLNMFSLIGIIMLTGLVGKNSILVVDFTNALRRQGLSRREALLRAGPARLRPILMTSAALIFAQIPLVLKLEEGSEWQAPLAVVVMGGMVTSTFLALVFVPGMYTIVDDVQVFIGRLARRTAGAPRPPAAPTPTLKEPEGKDETMNGLIVEGTVVRVPRRRLSPAAAALMAGTALAGTLLLGGCAASNTAKAAGTAAPPGVTIQEVRRETIRATYEGSGSVEAVDSVQVFPKTAGRTVSLNAEVGQRVQEGAVLAEIEHDILDTQVAQAEAGLIAAQARLAQLERGPRAEEVAIAVAQRDAAAQQAVAVEAQATAQALGLHTLDAQAKATGEQVRAARAAAAAARLRLDALNDPRPEDVRLLQGQVTLATIRLAQAQSRDEEVKLAASQIELANVSLRQAEDGSRPEAVRAAQAALDQARTALNNVEQMPVRAEDLAIARMNVEAAVAAYDAATTGMGDAVKSRNEAKTQAENLPFFLTRSQADLQLAQAEANVHQVQALIEQRRAQRDQARATYDKLASGVTAWDLRQTQLRVEQAQAQLDLTRNPDPERVAAARIAVEQARLGLDAKRKQITFDVQLAEEGVGSAQAQLAKLTQPSGYDVRTLEEQATAADAQAEAAQAQVEAIVSQRASAEAAARGSSGQAAAAGSTLRQAEAALALRQNPITAEDLRAARAQVQQAQAALDAAGTQQRQAVITAPASGVIGSKNASVGTMAVPQTALLSILSDAVEVSLPVEEARVAALRAGQRATVTAAALPGQSIPGTVVSISPAADPRSRSFTVRIRPDSTEPALRAGTFVQVSVQTEERPSAPVVARDALVQQGGTSAVYVLTPDNRAELRPVRVGLLSGPLAEILDGLRAGDKVVTAGFEDLRSGQLVTAALSESEPHR